MFAKRTSEARVLLVYVDDVHINSKVYSGISITKYSLKRICQTKGLICLCLLNKLEFAYFKEGKCTLKKIVAGHVPSWISGMSITRRATLQTGSPLLLLSTQERHSGLM